MLTLLAVAGDIPHTAAWTPAVGGVMIACNILAIAIGKAFMGTPSKPPSLPRPEFFGGMGLPALLATTSFGHIIGFGVILGLASKGIL